MMINISVISYATAAAFSLVLSVLLLTGWRGRMQGVLLLAATFSMVVWAACAGYYAYAGTQKFLSVVQITEIIRNVFWFAFLLKLLCPVLYGEEGLPIKFRAAIAAVIGFSLLLGLYPYLRPYVPFPKVQINVYIAGFLILSIFGLAMVEQLFRNTRTDERWSIKYLCLGIGGLFAYDFFLYSDALLFKRMDMELWGARGFVIALTVPLVAVSVARNPKWSLDVFVSRQLVFHTVSVLGAGLYLLGMAAGGYYIREHGGSWGRIAQISFFFTAASLLLLLLFSGTIRAKIKVYLNKHLFSYKYDYRVEWLRFIRTLAMENPDDRVRERAIEAIAEIVDSPGGMLWVKNDQGWYESVAHWNMSDPVTDKESPDSQLVTFVLKTQWVIDLREYYEQPEMYQGLEIPAWLDRLNHAWLVVPLFQHDELLGFIVLASPRTKRSFNWEDSDLLKTAGRQAAGYLTLLETTEALVDARQFEAFNRLSAYVVHDIKNVVAQLGLVVKNAEKHIGNPEFMQDAMGTVQNAVNRMNRLLAQLRKDTHEQTPARAVDLVELLVEVGEAVSVNRPKPEVICDNHGIHIAVERDRLMSVLAHLVQNAQEATADDGWIRLRLTQNNEYAVIEIEDNGCGMDDDFIRKRLFRPFDTTKGNAGMGIGVYESREFIHSLAGGLQVESQPGKGTLFRLMVPLLKRSTMVQDPDERKVAS